MSSDETERPSPFTRPGFIAAAVLIAVVVVLGIILLIVNLSGGQADPGPSATGQATSEPTATLDTEAASVCGLGGVELTGTVSVAPDASWAYDGTTAYPTSPAYGPGATDPAGFRYCFQHSPTGALFAAANAVSAGADPESALAWTSYFLAPGEFRDEILAESDSPEGGSGSRAAIVGFRVLEYDGDSALIDLAVSTSTTDGTGVISGVYPLVWSGGDWKLDTDTPDPLDVATIPNVAGYTAWGE